MNDRFLTSTTQSDSLAFRRARSPHVPRQPQLTVPDGPVLQRKASCACGGGCPRCDQSEKIRTKLRVSSPSDALEQEADRVANQVMLNPSSNVGPPANTQSPSIARAAAAQTATSGMNADPSVSNVLNTGGQAIESPTRGFMESRFGGADFSDVRIHSDSQAARSAHEFGAHAYTLGRDIVFGDGQYAPATPHGKQLLAHELTHVLQQGGNSERVVQRQPVTTPPATATTQPGTTTQAAPPTLSGGFATPREAAFAALALCNPKSIMSGDLPGSPRGFEYGGLIFKLGDVYHFTEPIQGEEGHVEVWQALSLVPAEARTSIVGDYHTHGSGKNERGVYIGEGEDFSGLHADALSMMLPSLLEKADIGGARKDVDTRPEILDRTTYTSYLGTPRGRMAIFIPAQNIVFSFSPDSRLLPLDKKTPSGASIDDHPLVRMSEEGRKKILDAAIAKLMNLQNRILDKDASLKGYDFSKPNAGLSAADGKMIRTISRSMEVYPNSLDWINDTSASRFFDVLRILNILYIQNRNMQKSHVVKDADVCNTRTTMARAETPMLLCRRFFDIGKEYSDNWCPALILTHEYFHYLNEPRSGVHIQHAENLGLMIAGWERRLADAYTLSDLAVQLALGREVDCELKTT
jgi:hypothetical protein